MADTYTYSVHHSAPKENFTIIRNNIFGEKELTYKAKGILCDMISLPPGWKFSIKGLSHRSADKDYSISNGLKELKKFGYLRITQPRGSDGKFGAYHYSFTDEPWVFEDDEGRTYYGELVDDEDESDDKEIPDESDAVEDVANGDESVEDIEVGTDTTIQIQVRHSTDKPNIENRDTDKPMLTENEENPNTENPNTDKPNTENPNTDNPTHIRTNNINNNIINNNNNKTSTSISKIGADAPESRTDEKINPKSLRGMYFPESTELSAAFREFLYMRNGILKKNGRGITTDTFIRDTKAELREVATSDGVFDVDKALDIVKYSLHENYLTLIRPENRKKWEERKRKPNSQDFEMKSQSYEGKGEEDLEKMFLAN